MDKRLRSFKEIKKRTNLTFFGWSWKNDRLFTEHQILWTSLINTIVFKERTSLQRKFWKNDRFISKRQILLIERFYKRNNFTEPIFLRTNEINSFVTN